MPINYPVSIDLLRTDRRNGLPPVGETVNASDINDIARYVNAIATELGIAPSGSYADVAARLAAITPGLLAVTTVTTTYTVLSSDGLVVADATGAPFTVTLPTPVGIAGKSFMFKRINAGANNVTIATVAGLIDGAATYVLVGQYQSVGVVSDGANWLEM